MQGVASEDPQEDPHGGVAGWVDDRAGCGRRDDLVGRCAAGTGSTGPRVFEWIAEGDAASARKTADAVSGGS
jgi:hypothetical protein